MSLNKIATASKGLDSTARPASVQPGPPRGRIPVNTPPVPQGDGERAHSRRVLSGIEARVRSSLKADGEPGRDRLDSPEHRSDKE
jgi:hypothetical protein